MPQLDPSTFLPQIFWLAVLFGAFFLLMKNVALPRIGEVLQARALRLNEDLDTAQRLRVEAERSIAEYQAALDKAKTEAMAMVQKARDEAARESARRIAEVEAKLAAQSKAAEARIAEAKAGALGHVRGAAADLAGSLVEKLVGQAPSTAELQAAVGRAMDRRQ
ncbi:MAG: F0F1 ATP synthase subunit B' [Alphaproteobacteria bacterium]|nr:F0F1 ATP synthase subunit B' [Alphaproteobacteria bacterium]